MFRPFIPARSAYYTPLLSISKIIRGNIQCISATCQFCVGNYWIIVCQELQAKGREQRRAIGGDDGVRAARRPGRPPKGEEQAENVLKNNSTIGRGTTAVATRLARLKRDAPEFAARYAAGSSDPGSFETSGARSRNPCSDHRPCQARLCGGGCPLFVGHRRSEQSLGLLQGRSRRVGGRKFELSIWPGIHLADKFQ